MRAQAAAAVSQGQASKGVMLYNRARQVQPDSPENVRLLRETLLQETAEQRQHLREQSQHVTMPQTSQIWLIFFSQNGQDRWIYETLVEPLVRTSGASAQKGVFVEAGAVDGVANSNTLFFERSLGWSGLLIEPGPSAYKHLLTTRPLSRALHMAVGGVYTYIHTCVPITQHTHTHTHEHTHAHTHTHTHTHKHTHTHMHAHTCTNTHTHTHTQRVCTYVYTYVCIVCVCVCVCVYICIYIQVGGADATGEEEFAYGTGGNALCSQR